MEATNSSTIPSATPSSAPAPSLPSGTIVRSIEGNKLVIDCDAMNYKFRMLEANRIPGLLPLEITENDGIKKLCYDITSHEAFSSLGTTRALRMEDIRDLLYSFNHIIKNLRPYLLDPDDLILDKDFIYVRSDSMEPGLCYLPGYSTSFASGLSNLLQDALGMVDHNDHDAVVATYSLYQESLKEGYVMADLIRILNNESSKNKETEGVNTADKDKLDDNDDEEKTTDELFLQYQMPEYTEFSRKYDNNNKNSRNSRNTKNIKNDKDARDTRDTKETRDTRDARDTRDVREPKDFKDDKDALYNAVSRPGRHKLGSLFSR